ncbi:hypothetical protein A8F94_07975 [Bacillus sp. FJAT-27225]|uniref:hypothetical protein n=1 Tax=Bacillus sp. FJAT-27225 TaxID=1743144 RepID=UPI00080C2EC5|nr:hypothetical protein [Bacillus sp. FJAT-27225]OCA88326.1 hypothetical protein A8F94_07975 [Bacillus sp. FJAT-27225]
MLTYFITAIFCGVSVVVTLFFKNELERMLTEGKPEFIFHICNIIIIMMVAFTSQAMITIYILGEDYHYIQQTIILFFIVLALYIPGHFAFEKYKFIYRKYESADDGKVLILNEKYLKKKKRFQKLKHYNAWAEEENK